MISKKKLQGILFVFVLLILGGCSKKSDSISFELPKENTSKNNLQQTDMSSRGTWCVYWDQEAFQRFNEEKKPKSRSEKIDQVVLFACMFDSEGELFIPDELNAMKSELNKELGQVVYLSFVNDVMQADGTAIQKSPDFLKTIFSNEEKMEKCIDKMLLLTEEFGCDGIELDFENIDREENLWIPYLKFVDLLYKKAAERKLNTRVVLGAYAPVQDYVFPEGPEYSVMCYNLFGKHSGPGPKADIEFLKEVARRYQNMENIRFALANGGFEWKEDGSVSDSLTTGEAAAIKKTSDLDVKRDPLSYALLFDYHLTDEKYTVWYGDEETVKRWESVLQEEMGGPVKIDLWRYS